MNRSVRVFFSSTFRDFGEERDLLVRRVFPALRAKLKDRFVELVDVDLRWGITAEQAESGEVLPICLAEIERARPYFIGMLGERYGWIPSPGKFTPNLLQRYPWLNEHLGGCSVTELEILHGVLNDPKMAGRAFFYFRSADYAIKKGGDYVAFTPEDAKRQADLKNKIRMSSFPVFEGYETPEAFAQELEKDLWQVLDSAYPVDLLPDPFERESQLHEAYALPRRRLYLGGDEYYQELDTLLKMGVQQIVIEGESGGGKSALLSNWTKRRSASFPEEFIFCHYTSASADAADSHALVRRLCEAIKRQTGSSQDLAVEPDKVMEVFPSWLGIASAYANKEGGRCLVVIDALNGLTADEDLRWWPSFIPERVHFIVSCLRGPMLDVLKVKGDWSSLKVRELSLGETKALFEMYLTRFNKTLPQNLSRRIFEHPLSRNPLFLTTLAEELRIFGEHEQLSERLSFYLSSITIDDLFERVLERVESDCGSLKVRTVMTGIWGSRYGLREEEILAFADLVPASWAAIRYTMDNSLLESNGRIKFSHDFLGIAVADRYLSGANSAIDLHKSLAIWFESLPIDSRTVEEVPYQWRAARDWSRLKACLTDREMFEVMSQSRNEVELLSYWLTLESNANALMERDLSLAWKSWDLDDLSEEASELADALRALLFFSGRYGEFTKRLAEISLNFSEKARGPEHPDTGVCLNDLGWLLKERGDYAGGEPLLRRALAIWEKSKGIEHPDALNAMNTLGVILLELGQTEQGFRLLYQELEIRRRSKTKPDDELLKCIQNLGVALRDQNTLDESESLLFEALEIAGYLYPEEEFSRTPMLTALGKLRFMQGRFDEAEELLKESLEIRKKVLQRDDPKLTAVALTLKKVKEAKKHI